MNRTEAFQVLGIEATKEEREIKNAYRSRLAVTNPEDDPEGFKRLRKAYEEACRYAKEEEEDSEAEQPRDTTPSGLWLERAAEIYGNIRSRQDIGLWKELFDDDIFLSLEEEENCRLKLLGFLTEHFKLPTEVWKLLDRKLSIVRDAKYLREKLPANFMHFIINRCERGEDLEFGQDITFPPDGDILWVIVISCVDPQLTFGQISHMAVRGIHLIIGSQKFLDGLYFCRRFHNY